MFGIFGRVIHYCWYCRFVDKSCVVCVYDLDVYKFPEIFMYLLSLEDLLDEGRLLDSDF